MDCMGWAVFWLIATATLTAVMIGAQLAGPTRLDLPLMLGTMLVADPDRARVAGYLLICSTVRYLLSDMRLRSPLWELRHGGPERCSACSTQRWHYW